ncbi:helix-turn-helix domain-containing protein [Microvirga terricola]|uniref:Helix-turn-helix domain-containing protein n=1 Tax=Microvirga terricola TaxID=2719797 RepID=A0ABX0V891_9HYPH|nr:helix-turn-helix transcriptional regulator [Microvirga terricola]NIX75275.1 helix-turn-helix domain-containing protein [Microvirga terricola]
MLRYGIYRYAWNDEVSVVKKSPSDADRHVGMRIRLRRVSIGMSQERLGDILGLTFQQVQKYEKGTNRVGAGRLVDIAGALGVSVGYFFEGYAKATPSNSLHDDLQPLISTHDGLALARAFARIGDTAVRKKLVAMVASVADALPMPETPETARQKA